MDKVINQHYVPRFYLKRFSDDSGNKIWVFDHENSKLFHSNVTGVASQRRFYDSELDSIADPEKSQYAEHVFSELERQFSRAINRLIEIAKTNGEIDDDLKREVCVHIYVQFIRTKWYRERIVAKDLFGLSKSAFHVLSIFQKEIELEFRQFLWKKTWKIGKVNNNDYLLVTSDQPVQIHSKEADPMGIVMNPKNRQLSTLEGIDIFFPLDPKHVLFIKDAQSEAKIIENQVYNLEMQDIVSLNCLQTLLCHRQTYCSRNGIETEVIKGFSPLHKLIQGFRL